MLRSLRMCTFAMCVCLWSIGTKDLLKTYTGTPGKNKHLPSKLLSDRSVQALDMTANRLISLKGIGKLTELLKLRVPGNLLKKLPSEMQSLTKLQVLDVSFNKKLRTLPAKIENLVQLQELCAYACPLGSLPPGLWKLARLQTLNLGRTMLRKLPSEIAGLEKLVSLDLSCNQLRELPPAVGNLPKLRSLNLSGNNLTHVPASFRNLRGVCTHLDLTGNWSLVEYGGEDGLGWRDLGGIFGEALHISQSRLVYVTEEVPIQQVYRSLRERPLYWNVAKFQELRPDPIPKHTLSEEDMLEMWRCHFGRHVEDEKVYGYTNKIFVVLTGEERGRLVEERIRSLYRHQAVADSSTAELRIDFLEAIFKDMRKRLEKNEGDEDVKAYLAEIAGSLSEGVCSVGQLEAFRMVYSALYCKRYSESEIEVAVRSKMTSLKEDVFRIVALPGDARQNVHVLDMWRFRLRDELGFDVEKAVKDEPLREDIYRGYPGNVLQVFYDRLTPEYAVREIKSMINQNRKMVGSAYAFLMGADMEYEERTAYMHVMFEFATEDDREMLNYSGISDLGVEELFVSFGMLVRNGGVYARHQHCQKKSPASILLNPGQSADM